MVAPEGNERIDVPGHLPFMRWVSEVVLRGSSRDEDAVRRECAALVPGAEPRERKAGRDSRPSTPHTPLKREDQPPFRLGNTQAARETSVNEGVRLHLATERRRSVGETTARRPIAKADDRGLAK